MCGDLLDMTERQSPYLRPMTIIFYVEGTPRPKQSYRHSKHGGYTPARVKAWQEAVALAAKQEMAGADPLAGPLAVEMAFHLPDRRKRDLDNLSKGVLDGMNGIVFEDDQQVTELKLTKQVSKKFPGVLVKVVRA